MEFAGGYHANLSLKHDENYCGRQYEVVPGKVIGFPFHSLLKCTKKGARPAFSFR
jgi:hypothetical protein